MRISSAMAGAISIVLLGAAGYGFYRVGVHHGARTANPAAGASMSVAYGASTSSAGSVSPAAAPAEGSQPALVDPSGWSIPEGEAATRRHMKDGLQAGATDPATGRKVLYYHDPMVPGRKFDNPGKSPFMDMMLVPAYSGGEGADTNTITVSPRIQQNLGLRTAIVSRGTIDTGVSAVGSIAWNEREQAIVQARAMGFVEKVHVRATLDRVGRGRALADVYVPSWVAAQQEYLSIRRMRGTDLEPLLAAARERMVQAGMSDAQIRQVEKTGEVQARQTIVAPIAGAVTELATREGMTIMPGMTLFRINGLASVWANAEVPERLIGRVRPGTPVVATSQALPGERFEGKVQAILPEVDPRTRTFTVRLQLDNPGGRLVPGMFAQMEFSDPGGAPMLWVPNEAVIRTGKRALVMIAEDGGTFRPAVIETGIESSDRTEVRRGLDEGQRVVLSGQFLIDSESSLKGLEARLEGGDLAGSSNANGTGKNGMGSESAMHTRGSDSTSNAQAMPTHQTEATLEAIAADALTLTHPPIASLKWPTMTMEFRPPEAAALPKDLVVGDRVSIEFRMQDGDIPKIATIRRIAPSATPTGKR